MCMFVFSVRESKDKGPLLLLLCERSLRPVRPCPCPWLTPPSGECGSLLLGAGCPGWAFLGGERKLAVLPVCLLIPSHWPRVQGGVWAAVLQSPSGSLLRSRTLEEGLPHPDGCFWVLWSCLSSEPGGPGWGVGWGL